MKCQKCDKSATFHITELTGGKPQELHLCEEHAREYLTEPEPTPSTGLTGALAQQLAVGQTAEELDRLDKQACPVCGITFFEFRNQGRSAAPRITFVSRKELDPLILNIHGELEHVGKRPQHKPGSTDRLTELIRLRRELKEAVVGENYERASEIRDEIRQMSGVTGAGMLIPLRFEIACGLPLSRPPLLASMQLDHVVLVSPGSIGSPRIG